MPPGARYTAAGARGSSNRLAGLDTFALSSGVARRQRPTDPTRVPCWPLSPLLPHSLRFFISWSLLNPLQPDCHSASEVATKPTSTVMLQGSFLPGLSMATKTTVV